MVNLSRLASRCFSKSALLLSKLLASFCCSFGLFISSPERGACNPTQLCRAALYDPGLRYRRYEMVHNLATQASPQSIPASQPNRPRGPHSRSLSAIIGSFKSAATKRVNAMRNTPGAKFWQRNYYEHSIHIIRNDEALDRIRDYRVSNPAQ